MKISVIIPAYNEGKRIRDTLIKTQSCLDILGKDYELIIVDDGSKDNTISVVAEFIEKNSRIKLFKNGTNRGKGYSVKKGMLNGTGDILLFSDADMSTPMETISNMIEYVNKGFDVVIGSRRVEGSRIEIHQNFIRENMGRIFNLLVRLIVVDGIKDTQCGFKLFTRAAARKIFELQRLENFVFDVEILYLAKKLGFKMVEVPVKWYNSADSKVHPVKDSVSMFFDLFKIRKVHRNF